MINCFNGVAKLAQTVAAQPVTWSSVTNSARGVIATAKYTLTVAGLSAVAAAAVLYARPEAASQMAQLLSHPQEVASVQDEAPQAAALTAASQQHIFVAEAKEIPLSTQEKAALTNKKQQQAVTNWLSKRYRVAGDAATALVSTAYVTAREVKIDPLLILAVAAIESGLNPFAESPVGAQGLMQVMSKVHHARFERLGGLQTAFNPAANIKVGSQILKEYVSRGGSVEAGLKTYVGAAAFDNDAGYGSRVMAELSKLRQVAAGKQVPTTSPRAPSVVAPKVQPVPVAPAVEQGEQMAALQ